MTATYTIFEDVSAPWEILIFDLVAFAKSRKPSHLVHRVVSRLNQATRSSGIGADMPVKQATQFRRGHKFRLLFYCFWGIVCDETAISSNTE